MALQRRSRKDRGAHEMARERLRIEAPEPHPLHERLPRDILPALIGQLRSLQEDWTADLVSHWQERAGKPWDHGTRPGSCGRQVLTVYVDHSIRLHELERSHKRELLQRLRAIYGADRIRSLRLQLDPGQR